MPDPLPIILDTDLGMGALGSDIDDGFALALALRDPALDLRLVTTVQGNTDVDSATALTLALLDRLDAPDVAVHTGAGRSLLRPCPRRGEIPDVQTNRRARPGHAANAMIDLVRAEPGRITIIAVGPLTNVALAMVLDPGFADALGGLIIMGGVFTQTTGMVSMPGEFNVWSDPDAAAIVLDSGVQARWVGLDVTRQVRIERADAVAMAESGGPFARFAGRYTAAWIDHLAAEEEPGTTSCCLHDPLAVAVATRPELVEFAEAKLAIQRDGVAKGVIIADRYPASGPANALIAVAVDAAAFGDYFRHGLDAAG